MNKICTTLEQSKKLIELGIDVNTADMCHRYRWSNNSFINLPCAEKAKEPITGDIPAWSLTALMNILPSEFTEVGKYSTTTYKINIHKYKFTDDVDLHQIAYGSYKWHEDGSCSWSDMINTGEKEDLLDAVFQMVIWLKENGKL